ncbi:MAG: mannose-1-phosphate guanylyltransferase/mannose-6-phosphate isomerase [Rhodobacteraceae bacterium]|nr:mannose-1-phosphate guanylyltransferase/mannose-6-phosphate isomerase [Paracoccaceae bacterium]
MESQESNDPAAVTPVLMCGGVGTRLWPLSRRSYPKQFTSLFGRESLFQASARRFLGDCFAPPVVITNTEFRFIVTEQLAEIGIKPAIIMIEPEARNTAPATLAVSLFMQELNPDALILVVPADHVLPDMEMFQAAVATGMKPARSGDIVTFAVCPDRPETGYGYMELGEISDRGVVAVKRFVEKPDPAEAEALVASGRFFWNSGLLLFSSQTMADAFEAHASRLVKPVRDALSHATQDMGFLRLAPGPWSQAGNISVDYAVLEQSKRITAVPYTGTWSDLGGWDSVWAESMTDDQGVALTDHAYAIDCQDVLLRSESRHQVLVGLGLRDIIAVAMPDAVLVADKARAQDVKAAVQHLKDIQISQAEEFPREHRPWGYFEHLTRGPGFEVRRITINPGAALTLQSHSHRAEHWVVVAGGARVTADGHGQIVERNQSVFIPPDCRHRLENPGTDRLIIIEVRTGASLEEDDVVRYV